MSEIENVHRVITLSRCELKNIRQEVLKLKAKQKKEIEDIKLILSNLQCKKEKKLNNNVYSGSSINMVPIGFISSCFHNKNGIPRQPSLCKASKASLEINKTFFTNPEHSLIGLSEFSFVWILFVFHKNKEAPVKAKVHPPRMNGMSVGVFSTRSPHRPCAIGLSLTKIEKIIGSTIFLSGVDLLDGTPVLDIKPYIPIYDIPNYGNIENVFNEKNFSLRNMKDTSTSSTSPSEFMINTSMNPNIEDNIPNLCNLDKDSENLEEDESHSHASTSTLGTMLKIPAKQLQVLFTERANKDIERFHTPCPVNACEYCLNFLDGFLEAKQSVIEILQNDPRSVYRKNKCSDKLYFFEIDRLHVTCWFDDMIAEVLKVKPINAIQQ